MHERMINLVVKYVEIVQHTLCARAQGRKEFLSIMSCHCDPLLFGVPQSLFTVTELPAAESQPPLTPPSSD